MGWGDAKMQWGDQDGDDEKGAEAVRSMPKIWTSAPDKNGIKTVTEYRTEDDGRKVKVIRKIKENKVKIRVNKRVIERRKWSKYGDCAGLPAGPEANITYPTYENINLQLKPRKREDDFLEEEANANPLAKLKTEGSIVVCRHCGETGHWTLKCPKRGAIEVTTKNRPGGDSFESSGGGGKPPSGRTDASGKYVPVHMREGADKAKEDNRREDDANTLRITNISEDTTEDDLRDLCRRFGHTSRIYLAKDRQTQISRGFAFVSYADRESAERCCQKLNGYGYDNLILHVEFAKPREEGPAKPAAGAVGAGKAGWTMRGTGT